MKEQHINELVSKARQQATSDTPDGGKLFDVDLFHRKFAELIVRECIEHCKGQLMDKKLVEEARFNFNDGVMDCAIGLMQHFGVEE